MRPSTRVASLLLALGIAAVTTTAGAQSPERVDTIAEARRLRDAGDFGAAASLMVPYVVNHPDDPGSARFAALMAYWSKDFATARSVYHQALERHSADADLRVEYAQFLMGVGETSRAREVVTPLVESGSRDTPATRQALTTLGTLEYWRGDYSRARTLFIEKLRLDSTDAEARRQLREIELASAAWIRVGGAGWHDDQPIDHAAFDAEGAWYLTPVTPLSVKVATTRFSPDGPTASVTRAEATITTFLPAARMDLSLGGGILSRSFGDGSDWTARVSLGFRLPRQLALEGRFERAPYLYTLGSLTAPIMTETLEGTLRWRASNGWMADAAGRREAFDDDNSIATGFAWILAPLVRRPAGDFHVGYSFSAQAAERSRFVPRPEDVSFPPGQVPSTTIPGIYYPYYTPRDLRVHSALVSAVTRPNPRWSLSANGSVGVHTRDDAPVLVTVSRPPNVDVVRTYYPREFTPYNVRGAFEGVVTDAVRLAFGAEHGKGAYYSFTTVSVRVTYTFVAAARRRADRY